MLRAVIKDARLVNDVLQIFRMARRKAVVTATLDKEQLIERISVGQPGGALLIGAKQIARHVESQPHGKTDAGAEDFASGKVRRHFENRSEERRVGKECRSR